MIVPLIIFITIIISYYAVLTSSMENYLTPRSLIIGCLPCPRKRRMKTTVISVHLQYTHSRWRLA